MPMPILLEGGLSFSQLFEQFSTDFGTVTSFFAANPVFLSLVAFPLGAFAIGAVIKAIR